ncbi:MAG: FAD-binding oxidoreductase [Sphingomonas sp.]|nr:FAD-binding oxidoreductase [Sphingomonas sp.]
MGSLLDAGAFEFVTSAVEFDIVIVGGGIAGAGLGWALERRGRIVIIEAEDRCGYHSTGRSAAFFLESYGGPDVARLNRASQDFLDHPPPEFSDRGYLRRRGALHISDGTAIDLPDGVESQPVDRATLTEWLPGLLPQWRFGRFEPGCADIDVARLHSDFLRSFQAFGGQVWTGARLASAIWITDHWEIRLDNGTAIRSRILVNAAGAWADDVALRSGIDPVGIQPKRRTVVQLRVGQLGLKDLPLVIDADQRFYFKGEGEQTIWLSPNDETDCAPGDAAPEEYDVALAIDRFQQVVDWPVEAVERRWAGLRSFAPDRLPVYGFEPGGSHFFWCAGQGGFGIQSSVAASWLAAGELTGERSHSQVTGIDPRIFAPDRFRRRPGPPA